MTVKGMKALKKREAMQRLWQLRKDKISRRAVAAARLASSNEESQRAPVATASNESREGPDGSCVQLATSILQGSSAVSSPQGQGGGPGAEPGTPRREGSELDTCVNGGSLVGGDGGGALCDNVLKASASGRGVSRVSRQEESLLVDQASGRLCSVPAPSGVVQANTGVVCSPSIAGTAAESAARAGGEARMNAVIVHSQCHGARGGRSCPRPHRQWRAKWRHAQRQQGWARPAGAPRVRQARILQQHLLSRRRRQ